MTAWRFIHIISILYFCAGCGAAIMPVWKVWTVESINEKVVLILSAQRAFTSAMLPGIIAVLFSGYAWAAATNYPLTTGWMIGLQGLLFLNLFLFIPLFGVALRRVKWAALSSQKESIITKELEEALADNVPLVFGTLVTITIPLMTWIACIELF